MDELKYNCPECGMATATEVANCADHTCPIPPERVEELIADRERTDQAALRSTATELIAAESAFARLREQMHEAQFRYHRAEKAYCEAWAKAYTDHPRSALVVDGVLLIVLEEWYDCKAGQKVDIRRDLLILPPDDIQSCTHAEFLEHFESRNAAMEFEARVLSVGDEFLPPIARIVKRGAEPTDAYWGFLLSQFKEMDSYDEPKR